MTTIHLSFDQIESFGEQRDWEDSHALAKFIDEKGRNGLFNALSSMRFSYAEMGDEEFEMEVVFIADLSNPEVINDYAKAKEILQQAFETFVKSL